VVTGALGLRWYDCVWTVRTRTPGRRRWKLAAMRCAAPRGWSRR
jgi:hypothetical protein